MLGPVLDTAIGLVFLFTILSAVTSGIVEYGARLAQLRSKTLLKGIQALLGDKAGAFWNEPLVAPSKQPSRKLPTREDAQTSTVDPATKKSIKDAGAPSYIASTIFSRTVASMLLPETTSPTYPMRRSSILSRGWAGYLGQLAAEEPPPARERDQASKGTTEAEDEAAARKELATKKKLATKLLPLAEAAGGDHDRFLRELETWFDDTMESRQRLVQADAEDLALRHRARGSGGSQR